ncbi:hypothetical protein APB94_03485 [Acinetobacter lactucae]|nr:hypothetical protein APB94_03485 [Acinetobacter lactucae]
MIFQVAHFSLGFYHFFQLILANCFFVFSNLLLALLGNEKKIFGGYFVENYKIIVICVTFNWGEFI